MVNKAKQCGDRWEREVSEELGGKRQPSSGAFGSIHNDSSLVGDVVLEYPWLSRPLLIECKYGYGGATQMTIRREWLTKARQQAAGARRLAALAIKFRDVTSGDIGSAKVICFNIDTWKKIASEINDLYMQYLSLLEKDFKGGEDDRPR